MILNSAEEVQALGYEDARYIKDRGWCALGRFIYTCAIVWGINEFDYRGRWCYESFLDARIAFHEWNGQGDPPGAWIVYKGDGGQRKNQKPEI